MASNLPIYKTLLKDCDEKDLSATQKTTLVKKIQALNDDGMELVYALIAIHAKEHEPVEHQYPPYDCLVDGTNITFCIDNLPNSLKQALMKFVNIHNKVMMGEDSM